MNRNPTPHCISCNRFMDDPCPWPDCELAGEPEHSWIGKHQPSKRSLKTPLAWFALFFSSIMAWYVIFEVIF